MAARLPCQSAFLRPLIFLEVSMKNNDHEDCKCGGAGNCPDCPNKKK